MLDSLIVTYVQVMKMLVELKKVLSVYITLNANNLKHGLCVCIAILPNSYDNGLCQNYGCESLTILLHYK